MRDPHIHVEKTLVPEFGHEAISEVITGVTGLPTTLPKTVATGCGRRRPIEKTSFDPGMVTCLACREYARDLHLMAARNAEALCGVAETDESVLAEGTLTLSDLIQRAETDRAMAARYATR